MKRILDASQMASRRAAHEYLQEQLELPEYYGKKLVPGDLAHLNEILVEKMRETQKEFLTFLAEKKNRKKKKKLKSVKTDDCR